MTANERTAEIVIPFPAGIEAASVASATTKTELANDDRDWIADHQAKTWFGQQVTTPSYRTTQHRYPTALHVPEENAHYHPLMEFIRRSDRQQDGWQARRSVRDRAAWVWSVPEPLRAGLLAVIDDIATTADGAITSALPDVLYAHIETHAGVNVGDYDDDEYQELTDICRSRSALWTWSRGWRVEATMTAIQRWEYIELVGRDGSGPHVARVQAYWSTDGQPYPYESRLAALKHLGQDGWELVGVATEGRDTVRLFLKRPLPS